MPANFSGFFFLPAIIFVLFLTNKMDLIFIYIYIFFFCNKTKTKEKVFYFRTWTGTFSLHLQSIVCVSVFVSTASVFEMLAGRFIIILQLI